MSPARKQKTIQRALREFRHSIALSIFRYAQNTPCTFADIHAADDIVELYDEYSLRVLISWLATKNGCSAYSSSIQSKSIANELDLCAPLRMECAFPYTTDLLDELAMKLEEDHFRKLDATLIPNLSVIGTLYELICGETISLESDRSNHCLEDMHTSNKRKASGQFYTPPSVVSYCLSMAFSKDSQEFMKAIKVNAEVPLHHAINGEAEPKHVFKMLDPSCGTGNFLIGALNFLKEANCGAEVMVNFAMSSLYGIEIDPRAASLARTSALLAVGRELQEICNSFGLDTDAATRFISVAYRKLCDHIVESDAILESINKEETLEEFDLVITNPPYLSFGARNQPKLPASSSTFLRQLFPKSAQYKISFYSVFQDICIRYAREGGRVVLLVPDSFLTGQYFEKLREHILAETTVISLTELPDNTIPGAVVGKWCVAVYERNRIQARKQKQDDGKSASTTREGVFVEVVSFDNLEDERNARRYKTSLAKLVSKDRSRFRLLFHPLDEQIVGRLEDLPPLYTVLRGHTGIRALKGRDSIVADRKLSKSWKQGLTSGKHVVPYRVEWGGDWLNIDPSLLFGGGFDPAIIENPKILIRQTADSITAAVDTTGLYHLNNVHSFSPSTKTVSLFTLVAILNSNLFRYLYRVKTREGGRALAQIDIETVECLPIASMKSDIGHGLHSLAERLISLSKCQESARECGCCDGNLISFTRRCVDRLVYELYGISEIEIQHIEEYVRTEGSPHFSMMGVDEALREAGFQAAASEGKCRS